MARSFLKPAVGLTRFLFLMNLCEKSGVWVNVYWGFVPFNKDNFQAAGEKLFVLHAFRPVFCGHDFNDPASGLRSLKGHCVATSKLVERIMILP